ncbi:sugar phosphate isomerase/epimerase family protein [Bremerella sp. T1]|uniref:sugar phosphate isomerase/epimerase family protein n=1 Tax=Bremerella sp. TYQ1 TaxID=3119568 RepID=UPI001CCB34CD|nr:sugar phosphate isomerase/epimerase family protein [Bremerella volcania]UBM34865.1 sugar phosphate isomerase/epimerase [Bremerella volcania]
MLHLNRRQMLQTALGTAAAAGMGSTLSAADPSPSRWKLITFTKFLQPLSYEEMADRVAEIGYDGIEAPIRINGHIEPKNVADELPKFVEALKKRGLTIDILTSSINSVDSPNAEETLKVAQQLGIPRYRMAYYRYDLKKPVVPQLREAGAQLKDLAAMNEEIGIQAVYQNHSGSHYVGAPIWDIMQLVRQYDPKYVSMAFDIGHARVEGNTSWPIQWNLVQSHLGSVYIKDFQGNGGRPAWCSVTEGQLPDQFWNSLKASQFSGPVSLHVEYLRGDEAKDVANHVAAMKRDLAWLKERLA